MAENCAGAYRHWALSMRGRGRADADLSLGDLGLPEPLPPNNATPLAPIMDATAADIVERVGAFFDGLPGGGYELWSAWPTPDLSPFGLDGYRVPAMIRPSGGVPPPPAPGLRVDRCDDAQTLRDAASVILSVFGSSAEPGTTLDLRVLDDAFGVWLGSVDGEPVATSVGYVGGGFVGVYAVATMPHARGRGYGEAVSWAATLMRPDLPATLQASPMGRPVYERMGFRTVGSFTVWQGVRSGSSA